MPLFVDPFAPLRIGALRFYVLEPRVSRCGDGFAARLRVEMQLVEKASSNHFDVTVWMDAASEWESGRIWVLARSLCREHFLSNRYPPRFSAHRYGVQLRWPREGDYTA